MALHHYYMERLSDICEGCFRLPFIPDDRESNGHLFYILFDDETLIERAIVHFKEHEIQVIRHFVPLHDSPGGKRFGKVVGPMSVTTSVAARLLRLPLYAGMTRADQDRVISTLDSFFNSSFRS